jgi:hypothetical protein
MSSPLNDITELESLIAEFRKLETKMNEGKFIPAFREIGRIKAQLSRRKAQIVSDLEKKLEIDSSQEKESEK